MRNSGRAIGGVKLRFVPAGAEFAERAARPSGERTRPAAAATQITTDAAPAASTSRLLWCCSRWWSEQSSSTCSEGIARADPCGPHGRGHDPLGQDNFTVDSTASRGIFIVADRMGGHAAGEVASEMAVQIVQRELSSVRDLDGEDVVQLVANSLKHANRAIHERTLTEDDAQNLPWSSVQSPDISLRRKPTPTKMATRISPDRRRRILLCHMGVRYATRASRAGRLRMTSVEPSNRINSFFFKLLSNRVTVSRDVPIICAISSWVKAERMRTSFPS